MLGLSNALESLHEALQGALSPMLRAMINQTRLPMDIKNVDQLPDSLPQTDLQEYFRQVLEHADSAASSSPEEIAKALRELSIRQWHTYTLLDNDLRRRIELWIQKTWDPNSETLTRLIVGIVGMLGLRSSLQLLKEALRRDLPPRVRSDIESGITQFGDTIDDPYARMKHMGRQ